MSKQPSNCSNSREDNPRHCNAQNAKPKRRNESQNVNYNDTTGIYRNSTDLNSVNCCTHSTPHSNSFQSQNEYQTFASEDTQGGYNPPQVGCKNNMSTQYTPPSQMQDASLRQHSDNYSSTSQGYGPLRNSQLCYAAQSSQQQPSTGPHICRKQQVSFVSSSCEIECPQQAYTQYPCDDQYEETPLSEDQEEELEESTEVESYQLESPKTHRKSNSLSANNKYPSIMVPSCPTYNPCFVQREVKFTKPQSNESGQVCRNACWQGNSADKSGEVPRTPYVPTSPYAKSYTTEKLSAEEELPNCCQNAYNFSSVSSSPKSSCAQTLNGKSYTTSVGGDLQKCCQSAYNSSQTTPKSSSGQAQSFENSCCDPTCMSQQSCTSDKSRTGKSKIPQRTTSTGSTGKLRKLLSRKPNREDTKMDSINMLSIVISTVMFMAAEIPEVPENYKKWSKTYLKCIKNFQGQSPPNIKKILKMLGHEDSDVSSDKCKCTFPAKPEESKIEEVEVPPAEEG